MRNLYIDVPRVVEQRQGSDHSGFTVQRAGKDVQILVFLNSVLIGVLLDEKLGQLLILSGGILYDARPDLKFRRNSGGDRQNLSGLVINRHALQMLALAESLHQTLQILVRSVIQKRFDTFL